MENSSTLVIKVKYGDVLRRFSSQIVGSELKLNMDGLRKKILTLFSFAPDTELMLTYVDEDGDVVSLVDDDDFRDAVKQLLNPLRITVKIREEKNVQQFTVPSGSSASTRMAQIHPVVQDMSNGFSELLKAVPEPLRESVMKISADLTSRPPSTPPGITEFVDYFSKLGLAYLGQLSDSHSRMETSLQSDIPGNTVAREPKDLKPAKSDPTTSLEALSNVRRESSSKNNETALADSKLKFPAVTCGGVDNPSPRFVAEEKPLNSQNTEVAQPKKPSSLSPAQVHCKSGVHSHRARKKEKIRKIFEGYLNDKSCLTNNPSNDSNNVGMLVDKGKSVLPEGYQKSPISIQAPYPMNECPFSGIAVGNTSAAPPHPAATQNNIFHNGVSCDSCGVHPIVGPRFKSKVKVNYDLCNTCFGEMGNDSDYIRMDFPMHHRGPYLGGYRGYCKVKPVATKLDSYFIEDVNIIDGTVMAPLTPFTKIWRMRNNGTVGWQHGTKLVWIGGDKLSNTTSVELEIPAGGVWINQELDIAVDFVAPEIPGRYISYWRMAMLSGQKFGQRVWVLIQVDASVEEAPRQGIRNLNLNLPPVNGSSTGPEIISVDPKPVVENEQPEINNLKETVELENVQLNTEQELKFPINDSLLVGSGVPNSVPLPSSVSYPIIDPTDVLANIHRVLPPPPPPLPPHPMQSDVLEDKLLRELEEMGFREVDLNKEILRMNDNNLEQTVDDLCGVIGEWDPILEELDDMGFNDRDTNKMLLKKNNGSIKRVVMDLVADQM